MFFEKLINKLNKIANLNEGFIWHLSIDNGIKKEIIRLNTIDQLRDEGIDSLGNTLGDYSEISVEVFGKREGHITLEDTGDFYNSFRVFVTFDDLTITANTLKDDTDLTFRFGKDIIGLTEPNLEKVKELILESMIKVIRKMISFE